MFYYDKLNEWFKKLEEKTLTTSLWDCVTQCDLLAQENDCSSEQFWINVMEQTSVDDVVSEMNQIDCGNKQPSDFVFKYI